MPIGSTKQWTYGLEVEIADWDTRLGWEGYGVDPEANIVNSNGIAADRSRRLYPFGGEINTLPTADISSQVAAVQTFVNNHPHCCVNYRCGLHVHIRVPGLLHSLSALKKVQSYLLEHSIKFEEVVFQSVPPLADGDRDAYRGACKRYAWKRASAAFIPPTHRIEAQLQAKTIPEFFAAEVPSDNRGRPLYHAQRRATVSLRQLLQTETVEFRCFWPTLDPDLLYNCLLWAATYLQSALAGHRFPVPQRPLPTQPVYSHVLETRWLATTRTKQSADTVKANIQAILAGTFDAGPKSAAYLIP